MKMAATAMMTEKEKSDFSHYGTKFQEGLVQLILDDRVFADQIIEVCNDLSEKTPFHIHISEQLKEVHECKHFLKKFHF